MTSMANIEHGEFYYCEIAVRAVGGKAIHEIRMTAPANAVLQALSLAEQHFIEWLEEQKRQGARVGPETCGEEVSQRSSPSQCH